MAKLAADRFREMPLSGRVLDRRGKPISDARVVRTDGNLRAQTARFGTTLVVGFNEEAYREVLG